LNDSPAETTMVTSSPAAARRGRLWLGVGLAVWGIAVAGGMVLMADYAVKPGEIGAAPRHIAPLTDAASGRCRLAMFVHARCPCTAASVAELARIMERLEGRVDAVVYLFRPESQPDDWTHGPIRDAAASIRGVRTVVDPEGRIAKSFGANTSGDVLVYDAAGKLRFHGGITPARGHEGESLGKSAVLAAVLGEPAPADATPVFGCVLQPRREPPAD
jgi:hypothetical protein